MTAKYLCSGETALTYDLSGTTATAEEVAALLLGTVLRMDFAAAKLLDLEQDWAALAASANPFAVVVMALAYDLPFKHLLLPPNGDL